MNYYGPLALRCPKCKVHEDYTRSDRASNRSIQRVGDVRERWVRVKRGRRFARQWLVWHAICGHLWWTTHRNAEAKPLVKGDPR